MDKCEVCSKRAEPVSYAVFESAMDRLESANKRWCTVCVLLIVLLVSAITFIVWRETQFETIEWEITQENEDGYNNFIGNDGDIYNGEANGQSEETNP